MAVKTYAKGDHAMLSADFRVSEFACHGCGCCDTVMVDEQLVTYLQQIRDHFGTAVTVNSGYRCAAHNKAVGGVGSSLHTKGMAADIAVKGIRPLEVARFAETIGVKGIGLYETAKDGFFVHIDTREKKGFWYGGAQESRKTFQETKKCTLALPLLQKNSRGEPVLSLQALLTARGHSCAVDGIFGCETDKAVRAFQEARGLVADGIVGPATWATILGV